MASKHARIRARRLCESALPLLLPAPDNSADDSADEEGPWSRALDGLPAGLRCAYVVDKSDRYEFLVPGDLKTADLSVAELHHRALHNLTDRVNAHLVVRPREDGTFALAMGGDFEATTLVLSPLWETVLAPHVDGTIHAVAPTGDVLVFGGAEHVSALAALADAMAESLDGDDGIALSGDVFRRDSNGWVDLD